MNSLENAVITWDESQQPISDRFKDYYFSKVSGLEEARAIFIGHNKLVERWQQLATGDLFRIFETGFGTGLNFLVTWEAWQNHAKPHTHLHYVSVEKHPLTLQDLTQALSLWPALEPLSAQLRKRYRPDANGFYRLHLSHNLTLTLIIGDALQALRDLHLMPHPGPCVAALEQSLGGYKGTKAAFDAWFLDGFSPAKNPCMWSKELFEACANLSGAATTFATFTAASAVRRGLQAAGFEVKKHPGFGGKREILAGSFSPVCHNGLSGTLKPNSDKRNKLSPSWHLNTAQCPAPKSIAVIGAGLAGAQTAYRLAKAGFSVTVFDQHSVASGGSGNPQGALYTKLSALPGALADFNLNAYRYACQFYRDSGLFEQTGDPCGLLQLAHTQALEGQFLQVAKRHPTLVTALMADACSDIAGVPVHMNGLFFKDSGWLNPILVCRELLNHPNIRLVTGQPIQQLQTNSTGWALVAQACPGDSGQIVAHTNAVVLACAQSAAQFSQCQHLPTKAVRGQVTNAPTNPHAKALKTVLCAEGYIAPAQAQQHCLGATFTLKNHSSRARSQDNQKNLANAGAISPAFQRLQPAFNKGDRVSFRCTTPDYLPIVGPVANEPTMLAQFAKYRQNFKHNIDKPGDYWPGLFINIGHGSRGLTYTPLCAELICSMFTGAPMPMSRAQMLQLHSARFLIRGLARNSL